MNQTTVGPDAAQDPHIVWYRNVQTLRIVAQVLAVAAGVGLMLWFFSNLLNNLDRRNIGTDFGFLSRPTNFQVPYDEGFNPRSPVTDMIIVGLKNTFLAGAVGIVLASILGLIIGIARLSSNWLVAKLAMLYVEVFRNIPPLVIIIFFGAAVFTNGPFPVIGEANTVAFLATDNNFLVLSNTVWGIPSFIAGDNIGAFWITLVAGFIAAGFVARYRTKLSDNTGVLHHRVRWALATFVAIGLIGFLVIGNAFSMSWPSVGAGGRVIEGGFIMNFGFISVTVALGLYTASHIAEIIRGSILAVPKGQSEAANAIALTSFQRYRYIILPQALRIALPPTINQYLNLVKNTSLGIAVAYAEITALTTSSIGNGRPAPQSIAILMLVYVTFSLTISVILNVYNRRLQLVER